VGRALPMRGNATDAAASVAIGKDTGERVVLEVDASAPGFVVLADEYGDGWTATVNRQARDVVRADYAFRLVAVPAGRSEVVFAYRPWAVRVGLVVSLGSLLAVGIASVMARNPPRAHPSASRCRARNQGRPVNRDSQADERDHLVRGR